MGNYKCTYCQSGKTTAIDSYKHFWIKCQDCGNVYRERKTKTTWDNKVTRLLSKYFFGFRNTLLPMREVIEDESKYYEYYRDAAIRGTAEGTKWNGLYEDTLEKVQLYGIRFDGQNVMDISGGPGFLARDIAQNGAKRAVVTEYSKVSADAMGQYLNIESLKYDYNTDSLEEIVEGKFDVFLLIYSIGFCNNLAKLASSIKAVASPGAFVYLTYSPPTLGLMMRWQFDEYTYNHCWTPETVAKHFVDNGFSEVALHEEKTYPYNYNWFNKNRDMLYGPGLKNRVQNFVLRSVRDSYRDKALEVPGINKELVQRDVRHVFKLPE